MGEIPVQEPTRPEIGPDCDEWPEEVWDGVPFMPPMPNNEHASLSSRISQRERSRHRLDQAVSQP